MTGVNTHRPSKSRGRNGEENVDVASVVVICRFIAKSFDPSCVITFSENYDFGISQYVSETPADDHCTLTEIRGTVYHYAVQTSSFTSSE